MTWMGLAAAMAGLLAATASNAQCLYSGTGIAPTTTVEQEVRDAPIVVRARVVSQRNVYPHDSRDPDGHQTATVRVLQAFKGGIRGPIRYFSWKNSSGFDLRTGPDYLLFLTPAKTGEFGPNEAQGFQIHAACGQSRPWSAVTDVARAELQRMARRPSNARRESPDPGIGRR